MVVIDDSRSIRAFVVSLLKEAGYDAEAAPDGVAGLELVALHEPDVILLDVEMPGMSGLQVLDRLAGQQHLFSIIICTTHSEMELIVDAFTRGADDYIVKPFNEKELLARVAAAERTVALKRTLSDACHRADEFQTRLIEEKKLQAISRLAAGVAHEINNPLGFIRSNLNMLGRYAEFLLGSVDACLKENRRDGADCVRGALQSEQDTAIDGRKLENTRRDLHPLIDETQQGVDRIAGIVRCFKNLEQGISVSREVREEELNSIIRSLINVIRPEMPEGVLLLHELASTPLPVMGTLGMLNLVFENLLQNAVDAVGSHGEITIKTGCYNTGHYCEICDSGPGIGEEIRPLVFEPFFSTKIDGQHFGLGLTIAECFVTAHGGTIEIAPDTDRGTRLRVSLPMAGCERNPRVR